MPYQSPTVNCCVTTSANNEVLVMKQNYVTFILKFHISALKSNCGYYQKFLRILISLIRVYLQFRYEITEIKMSSYSRKCVVY